jgi:ribosomal protein S1
VDAAGCIPRLVNVGDMVDVMVLDVNRATKRISLGMKQVKGRPVSHHRRALQAG